MTAEQLDYLSVEDLLEIAAGVMDHVVVRDAGLLAAAAAGSLPTQRVRPDATLSGYTRRARQIRVDSVVSLSTIRYLSWRSGSSPPLGSLKPPTGLSRRGYHRSMQLVSRVLAAAGLVIVGWALASGFPAIVHGHPAYAIVLVVTVLGCGVALWVHRSTREPEQGWRRVGSVALTVGAVGWLLLVWWSRPFSAQEPALAAMQPDDAVTVTESAARIVLEPTGQRSSTSVFFQPGAKVEARAYAAVLRPLAETGHRVVIVKQPMGIAFLSLSAFDSVRSDFPAAESWVLGGHSLGGTVAAMQAEAADSDVQGPARGLLLYASYPGGDMSDSLSAAVLSISGTHDGLATPADIEASKLNLPENAQFSPIEGAVHAFFGDYGPQPGDGEPTISHDEARTQISDASVGFVSRVSADPQTSQVR